MYPNCIIESSICAHAAYHDVQHLLDLSWAEGGGEVASLLNVSLPQPLAQLIQLLHAHCRQLTGECATLPSLTNRIKVYSQTWRNRHTPACRILNSMWYKDGRNPYCGI